jgi:hypothetical protein
VANVIAAGGYDAVLVFNRTGTDACNGTTGMSVEGNIPTFGVAPRGQGFAIFDVAYDNAACLAGTGPAQLPVALGTKGDTLRFSSTFDGWGYVHLFRYGSGKMAEDTYAIPEAHDPAFASDSATSPCMRRRPRRRGPISCTSRTTRRASVSRRSPATS